MRRRMLVLILLPVLLFLWMIGWSLYLTGDRSKSTRVRRKQKDNVQIVVGLETPEITEQVVRDD